MLFLIMLIVSNGGKLTMSKNPIVPTSCPGTRKISFSLPWQMASVSLTNSSINFLALSCFLFISFLFSFI